MWPSPLWLPMRALGGSEVMGECVVIVAQKAEPDLEIARTGTEISL
jgi:hypothetical protein